MMKKILVLVAVMTGSLFAEGIVRYNPTTKAVLSFGFGDPSLVSGDTLIFREGDLTTINDLLSRSIPLKYWIVSADSIVEMSQAQKDSVDTGVAAADTVSARNTAKDGVDKDLIARAAAEIVMREVNLLRQWTRDFKDETAAATSLANFQSRVAGLPTLNDRTLSQLQTQIKNRIDSLNVQVLFQEPTPRGRCGGAILFPGILGLMMGLWAWLKKRFS